MTSMVINDTFPLNSIWNFVKDMSDTIQRLFDVSYVVSFETASNKSSYYQHKRSVYKCPVLMRNLFF